MSLLSDRQIREYAHAGMITPFEPGSVSLAADGFEAGVKKVISFGTGSYGYDARLGDEFMLFQPYPGAVIDPKNLNPNLFLRFLGPAYVDLPPHSYMLGHTVETFNMPNDVTGICLGKSTYARCGLLINTTPLEAGWVGTVTLEIANLTPCPIRVYANEGICQVVFLRGEEPCIHTYATKNAGNPSKYQGQSGVTLAKA